VLARPKRRAGRGFANLSRAGYKSHLDIIFKMVDQQCFISAFHTQSLLYKQVEVKTITRKNIDWS
jgi:hypothetical protein